VLQKASRIPDPYVRKAALPDLSLISEISPQAVGESALDELHGLFNGNVARKSHQEMQMIWHNDEVMQLKLTGRYIRSAGR
jgi:hypothetical protein